MRHITVHWLPSFGMSLYLQRCPIEEIVYDLSADG